jgi:hypothetical protein
MEQTAVVVGRDTKNGRFVAGNSGNGGRRPGSRNRLGEAFLSDLAASWQRHGPQALERCALEEPGQYLRVVASLMPKELDLSVNHHVQVEAILADFRGIGVPDRTVAGLMRLLPKAIIDADAAE